MLEHAGAKIDELNPGPRFVLEQYVLGLNIRVDNIVLAQEDEGIQDLDGEGADVRDLNGVELVQLHQLI